MEPDSPARPSRSADQFVLRMPAGMREALKRKAAENQRSLNSEIVFHLSAVVQLPAAKEPQQ